MGSIGRYDFLGNALPKGHVTFAEGERTQTITVLVSGDTSVEVDEGFTMSLNNPTNAILATATATAVIRNDNEPTPPSLTLLSTTTFIEDSTTRSIGSVVATFATSDTLSVSLSDTVHYAFDTGQNAGNNEVLTAAGLSMVESGIGLPSFTLTPTYGAVNGTAVSVSPLVLPSNDGPAGLNLGSTSIGYALRDGSGAPLQVTYPGGNASASNPGNGWSALAPAQRQPPAQ